MSAEYTMHSGVRYVVEIHVMSYNKASTPIEKVIIPGKATSGQNLEEANLFPQTVIDM